LQPHLIDFSKSFIDQAQLHGYIKTKFKGLTQPSLVQAPTWESKASLQVPLKLRPKPEPDIPSFYFRKK
jgi:hypothetical protein